VVQKENATQSGDKQSRRTNEINLNETNTSSRSCFTNDFVNQVQTVYDQANRLLYAKS
jgi:predicted GTPase